MCYNSVMRFFKTLFLFIAIFLLIVPSYAVQDVFLDIEGEASEIEKQEDVISDEGWHFDLGGKSLGEKIKEINSKEINDISKSSYLLEGILTKNFDDSFVESMHLFGHYRAGLSMNFYPDDEDLSYDFSTIEAGVNGKLKGNNFYETRFRFKPQHNYNFFQFLPSNVYVANTSIPHHKIIIGNTRVATGHEGNKSVSVIPFVARSQISRNFGDIRKLGVRVKGNYDLVEYDLGGYSSDTYFRQFFPGAEFASWVTLKPLGKTEGKYGTLKMGSGLTSGKNDIDYTVLGAYTSYEYKKLYANFEWGKADGYNGARGISSNKAEGFYTTLGYRITPKLQLVGRYDYFRPNTKFENNTRKEYSAGLNYFVIGQALKFMLNYVFCQNDAIDNSHRIILGTQLML